MNDNTRDAPASESPHDALRRKEADEPVFGLLARDPRAPDLVTLYAALRDHNFDASDAVYKRLRGLCAKLPRVPKDTDHAWSARGVATSMSIWRYNNVVARPAQQSNTDTAGMAERVMFDDLTPTDAGAFNYQLTIDAIKAARPPLEPDEAS